VTRPDYVFLTVCEPADRITYFMVAYPMRGYTSSWWIAPGTILQDVPLAEFDLPPTTNATANTEEGNYGND
jgi:hypothetical protein